MPDRAPRYATTTCVLALTLATRLLVNAQTPIKQFRYTFHVGNYLADPVYVPKLREPAEQFLAPFEAIEVRLTFGNRTSEPFTYSVPSNGIESLFKVSVIAAPSKSFNPRLSIARIRATHLSDLSNVIPSNLQVRPADELDLEGTLEGFADPGFYEVRVVPVFPEPAINSGVIRVEIGDPSVGTTQIEFARRRMIQAMEDKDCNKVKREAARLMELHPSASEGYRVQGECAERTGQMREAAAEFRRAADLVRRGRDELLLKNLGPWKTKLLAEELVTRARTAEQKARK